MNGIGKQAAFYRGYLPDDRSNWSPWRSFFQRRSRCGCSRLPRRRRGRGPPRRGRWARRLRDLYPRPSGRVFADRARYLRPRFSALLCNRGQLRSRHAELTPQIDKRRGRGGKLTPGCIR